MAIVHEVNALRVSLAVAKLGRPNEYGNLDWEYAHLLKAQTHVK